MALGMDMIADPALREKVAAKFVAKLAANDNHLTTGFLGTPWLLPALSSIDRDDLAYTMLLHKDYPSWGYEIEKGATTMWERWNSIMPDGSFGPVEMNSFNHYAYGAVGDWMYQNIGGIKALEAGYKVSRIAPVVGGGLTHGAGEFDSAYGPITTDWTLEDEDLSLQAEVPVNTTAEVVLPAANAFAVTEGGAAARRRRRRPRRPRRRRHRHRHRRLRQLRLRRHGRQRRGRRRRRGPGRAAGRTSPTWPRTATLTGRSARSSTRPSTRSAPTWARRSSPATRRRRRPRPPQRSTPPWPACGTCGPGWRPRRIARTGQDRPRRPGRRPSSASSSTPTSPRSASRWRSRRSPGWCCRVARSPARSR